MRAIAILPALFMLASLGCQSVVAPLAQRGAVVTAVVRYPDRTPVYRALVTIEGEPGTYTDLRGRYQLTLKAPGDHVTVFARDGNAPGMQYATIRTGSASVAVTHRSETLDVVLEHTVPF